MTTDHDQLRAALLDLTPAQQTAAEALASGATHAAAAEAAGVARETVTRWTGHHPGFRAALGRYRAALAAEQADTARRIRGQALAVIETQLDHETADLADALAVLRSFDAPAPESERVELPEDIMSREARVTRMNLPAHHARRPSPRCPGSPVLSMP